MANWNFNSTMSAPKLDTRTNSEVGGDVGAQFGSIAKNIGSMINQPKIGEYIRAYNDANDQTIFGGLKGSARTEKLSMLLRPIDMDASNKYKTQADNEKKAEGIREDNTKVVEAGQGVATSEEVADTSISDPIDAEIKLIEDELTRRSTPVVGTPQGIDINPLPQNESLKSTLDRYKLMGTPNA